MSTTFEISAAARTLAASLMDIADQQTGEVDEALYDEWFKAMEALGGELSGKLVALRAVRDRLLGEETALKAEAKRIGSRAQQRSREAERVRGYMLELLQANRDLTGADRVDTPDGSYIRLNRRTSYEVSVTDMGAVHEVFLVRPEPRIDKKLIVATHKESPESASLAGLSVNEVVSEYVREGA